MMISTLLPRLSYTWRAVVGDMLCDRLAEGAAIGTPDNLISSRAMGCLGIRTVMVGRPAHTRSSAELRFLRFKTKVSGPGQNFWAKAITRSSV